MTEPTVLDLFEKTGAYLRGHFCLTSGLHSPEYLQCARVLQYPAHAERLGRELALALRELVSPSEISAVAAPALGGLIIGHEVARALGVRFIFSERESSGAMALRRGFSLSGEDVAVVVEDVITTGGSSRETIALLRAQGARVAGAGCVIDRSGGRADLGVPATALALLNVTAWPAESCPLCKDGVPVVKPGSRPS